MALSPLSPSRLNSESISNWFNAASSSLSPSKSVKGSSNTSTMSLSSTTISDTDNTNNTTTPKYDRNSNSSLSSSKKVKDSLSSWRESSSSPFLDEIDQENVAPALALAPSPRSDTASFETPTRLGKRSTGLKESPCSPLATPAVTDASGDAASPAIASVGNLRSARQRYHDYQRGGEDGDHGNIQILSDEAHTTGSPEKRIADVMLRSVDVTPSGCSTPNADATVSPRTSTTKTRGTRSGNGSSDDCGSGNITAASGLLPESAIKYGRVGELLDASDGSPSKKSCRGGTPTIAKNSISPGPRDEPMLPADEQANIDDTCFTAFSEIPNAEVTQYTKMPSGLMQMVEDFNATPKNRRPHSPLAHSPSPSPLRHANHNTNDADMTNLLDFTQQMESFSNASRKSPSKVKPLSPMKFQSQPNLLSFISNQRSPAKANGMPSTPAERQSILNLLDFELPPAPTPRSIPTVTARELESLKSQYLSEISSLKATLSGKCAEVDSLKNAVNDAERRVGQAQEELREECSAKEHAERERTVWEKKGKEVEDILQAIRKEVMNNEKEMEQLESRLQDSERRAEDAEAREADAKMAAAEAERKAANLAAATAAANSNAGPEEAASADLIAKQVQKELDEKIGGISSELHAVYKKKHETKVATLKKSYEARAEKKCAELQKRIGELSKQNEELQLSKDATFSGVLPKDIPNASSRQADLKLLEQQKVEIEQQRAKLVGMVTELESVKGQQAHLLHELEIERAEKGELVAAAEEMLGLQHDYASTGAGVGAGVDDFRKSISRCSGLRPPTASSSTSSSLESRIGRVGGSGSNCATGLARPMAGLKSKMMSNIERMGGGGGM